MICISLSVAWVELLVLPSLSKLTEYLMLARARERSIIEQNLAHVCTVMPMYAYECIPSLHHEQAIP